MRFNGIFILSISLAACSTAIAQSTDDTQYNYVRLQTESSSPAAGTILSLGLGFGGYYPNTPAIYVENPNITISGERTVVNNAGPGKVNLEALLSYKSIYSGYTDYYTGYDYEQRWDYYILGTRLSYHIEPFGNKKMELYAGVMAGYYITSFKFTSNDPDYAEPTDPGYSLKFGNSPNFFAPGIFAGIRSWITRHSSVWIETGYGFTSVSFGASYKI